MGNFAENSNLGKLVLTPVGKIAVNKRHQVLTMWNVIQAYLHDPLNISCAVLLSCSCRLYCFKQLLFRKNGTLEKIHLWGHN